MAFALMILGGLLSYAESELGAIKVVGYFLGVLGLAFVIGLWGIVSPKRIYYVLFFVTGMATVSILSLLVSDRDPSVISLIQILSYPVILFATALVGFRILQSRPSTSKSAIVVFAFVHAAIAILNVFGVITSIPIFGEIVHERYIWGSEYFWSSRLPSSSGLSLDVNYFAVTQASLAMLYGMIESYSGNFKSSTSRIIFGLIVISSFFGSSRGVTVALLSAFVTLMLIGMLLFRGRVGRRSALVLAGGGVIAAALFINYYDLIYTTFRLYEGLLGSRGGIWGGGLSLWLERPLLGWGGEIRELVGIATGGVYAGRSLHSGYLNTLVRGGIFLALFTFGFVLFAWLWGLGRKKETWMTNRWAVAIIVFYLVNTAFRTFSIGGLGLLSIVVGIALSVCLFANWRGGPRSSGMVQM